ncbi:hypothetical protein [Cupriavidus sp. 8B]
MIPNKISSCMGVDGTPPGDAGGLPGNGATRKKWALAGVFAGQGSGMGRGALLGGTQKLQGLVTGKRRASAVLST